MKNVNDSKITRRLILSLPEETVLGTYILDWDSRKRKPGKVSPPSWIGVIPDGVHERLNLWESAKAHRVTGRIAWILRGTGKEILEDIKSTYPHPYMTPDEFLEGECVSIKLNKCDCCDEAVPF